MPRWLAHWTPSESFSTIPPAVILLELYYVSEALVPAGEKAAGICLAKACEQFGTPDNWGLIVDDFLDELSQLPPDLLQESWRHIRRTCKFMPKIADFLEPVLDKIAARQIKKRKLEMMLSYAQKSQLP